MLNQLKSIFYSPLSNLEELNPQKKDSNKPENFVLADTVEFQIQQGDKLYHQGKLDQALAYYHQAVEIDSNSAQAHQKLAMALQKRGHLPEAMSHYRKAIVLNNVRENLAEEKKSLSLDLKITNFEPATQKYIQINESSHLNVASKSIDKQHLPTSQESTIQPALLPTETVTPNFKREAAEVYLQQALAYGDEQKWQEAINACQHAIQISPDLAEAYKLWGNALQRMGETSEAMGYYAKALELQPDLAEVYANLGTLYAQQKKWQKAREYYQKAIAIKPNFGGAYRNLAKVWQQLGEPEKAAECQNKSLGLGAEAVDAEKYILLGDRLRGENKLEQALEYYFQAIQLAPDLRIGYQKIAETWEKLGKWQEAATYYRQMLTLPPVDSRQPPQLKGNATTYALPSGDSPKQLSQPIKEETNKLDLIIAKYKEKAQQLPDSASLKANLGSLYAQKQEWHKAATYYQRAIELNPTMAGAYRNLAKVLEKLGKETEATQCWYQALSIEPQNASAENHCQLGDILSQQNQLEQAIFCYRRAIELKPTYAQAYFQMGGILNQLGKWDDAVIAYTRALKLDKNLPDIYQKLGNAILQRIKLDEQRALELFIQAIQQQPENAAIYLKAIELKSDEPELYLKLGNILLQREHIDEAIFAYSRAIELQPENSELRLKLGNILLEQGQWDNAIDCYTRAIKVNPNSYSVHLALGKVLMKQNELDKAVECFRKATELNPTKEEPYHYLADGLCQQGKLDEAIAVFNHTLHINPNYYWAYHCLGNIYVWQERLDDAVAAYRQAIELKPDLAVSYKNLGDVLAKQGKVDEASHAYRQALQFDPQVI